MSKVTALGGDLTNGAQRIISVSEPYIVRVGITGVADVLFHRWDCDAVKEKGDAAKGSKAKRTDDLESYVYRDDTGMLCMPGENLRMAVVLAAKFRQDPRSPRKSAYDLYRAGVISLTPLASLGLKDWNYEHKCRVQIQRNGVTRVRPALKAGWAFTMDFMVNVPEYISPDDLHDVLTNAGRLCGLCDFRPTYGRFQVRSFEVQSG